MPTSTRVRLRWPDGATATIVLTAAGTRVTAMEIAGASERLRSIQSYQTVSAVLEECRFIAARDQASIDLREVTD